MLKEGVIGLSWMCGDRPTCLLLSIVLLRLTLPLEGRTRGPELDWTGRRALEIKRRDWAEERQCGAYQLYWILPSQTKLSCRRRSGNFEDEYMRVGLAVWS